MKTRIEILTLCFLLVALISTAKTKEAATISGQSLTELGDYQISQSPTNLVIAGEALKTYELKYSNGDTPVQIGIKKTKRCMNFVVRTHNFEVMYVCNNHVFGVKRINKEWQTVSDSEIARLMDNADFYTQRVISQIPRTESELLGLIACYFPSLLKSEYLSRL